MKTIKNLTADQIRKSILQLAIQGKLVKQDPNDEPASELVKKIYAEKKRLIAEGKIKKDKNESFIFKGDDNCYYEKIGKSEPIKLEGLPFDIPDNWTWVRFPNLVNFVLGKTPERHNPKYWSDGKYPWFSIADMKDKSVVHETKEKISEDSLKENFNYSLSPIGTLLMSFKLTVGRVSILGVDAVHNEAIISIFPYLNNNNDIRDWLFYTLGILVDFVDQTDAIKGSTLNKEKMSSMLIPLPPLPEQRNIINKINSFEPLLQEYDSYEKKLSKLEEEFPERLKKSILQYAIEGKLVKQDPNDEPASVLLERIKEEKESLIKTGKIKRDKNESCIYQGDDKNYYEKLPALWSSKHLSELLNIQTGASFGKNDAVNEMKTNYVRVLRGGNILPFRYLLKNDDLYIPNSAINKDIFLKQNDIITPAVTSLENIGKIAVINKDLPNVVVGGFVYIMKPFIDNYYFSMLIMYFMSSPTFLSKMISIAKKSGQAFYNMNKEKLKELILPIPGMNEIKSLVTKINYLFQIIDSYQ